MKITLNDVMLTLALGMGIASIYSIRQLNAAIGDVIDAADVVIDHVS